METWWKVGQWRHGGELVNGKVDTPLESPLTCSLLPRG